MLTFRLFGFWLFLILLSTVSVGAQTNVEVGSAKELRSALEKARVGTSIILLNGVYDFNGELKISARGSKEQPLRIVGKHRGKATVVGDSRFVLTAAEHIVIEGLNFESTNGPAIELRGSSYVRVTRNTFHLKETKRGSWILIDGIAGDSVRLSHHNRVDHNTFEKKSLLGNFITIEGTMRSHPQVSQYDRIDHNLFADIGPRVENVLEAIRAGSSVYSLSSGYTVIEANLFERCDGDPEYISIKSSDDTIRYNTFRECLGSLSLRHGNRNTVEGNYVLGNNRTGTFLDSTGKTRTLGTGGVRFYGTGMRIIGNYFEGLTGKQWDATFAITSGNAEYGDGQPLTKHFRIHDATIAFNTLVNNASNLEIGYDGGGFQGNWWHLPPIGMRIEGNIIVGTQDTLIKLFTQPVNSVWANNVAWASGNAVAARTPINGVQITEPHLVKTRGVWHVPNRPPRFYPLKKSEVGPDAK
jgi:poly(beta-D-mannuronate) lyase